MGVKETGDSEGAEQGDQVRLVLPGEPDVEPDADSRHVIVEQKEEPSLVWDAPIDLGTLEDWIATAQRSSYGLVNGPCRCAGRGSHRG